MKKVAFLLMAGTALFGATRATAQEAVTASITIPRVLAISVNSNTVTFDPPTAADYDGTGSATLLPTTGNTIVATRGNVLHDVTVEASTATFGFTPAFSDGDPSKPAGDLRWSADAGATWAPMATAPADVASSLSRGVNAAAATVRYRLLSTLAKDPPGDYSLTFVYSVVPN